MSDATALGENREQSTREPEPSREAGRALDALVAEKVMGYRWRVPAGMGAELLDSPHGYPAALRYPDGELRDSSLLPHYSTDIAAAMPVLDHMAGPGFRVDIRAHGSGQYDVAWFAMNEDGSWSYLAEETDCDSLPLAICRAALAAMEARP